MRNKKTLTFFFCLFCDELIIGHVIATPPPQDIREEKFYFHTAFCAESHGHIGIVLNDP